MNFFKEKVQNYQEKKLREAKEKLNFHTQLKNNLEKELEKREPEKAGELKGEIEKQKEFMGIWKKNIDKIKEQIIKLNKK